MCPQKTWEERAEGEIWTSPPFDRKRAAVAHGRRRTFLEFYARREEQPS